MSRACSFGESPLHVVDEWQDVPLIWNYVRHDGITCATLSTTGVWHLRHFLGDVDGAR